MRIIGWNVQRTSLEEWLWQELQFVLLAVSAKTCLAESVFVICFKCTIIVSELSIVRFSPVLLNLLLKAAQWD